MKVQHSRLAQAFQQFLPEREVDEVARETGFLKRKRKATPYRFLFAVVLGATSERSRSISGLRRFFSAMTEQSISSAAFQKRFSNAAANMFERILGRLLQKSLTQDARPLPPRLRRFRDVLAVDSTAFSLKDKLAKHFRGFKSRGTRAMARITTTMSLRRHQPTDFRMTSGRTSETRGFKITRRLEGQLVTFDLGFFSFRRFRRLARVGAFYVSRLKEGVNPEIVSVHLGEADAEDPIGRRFSACRFSGRCVDLDARFGSGEDSFVARVAGVWDEASERYHWYMTNVSRDILGALDVSETYRLRWQVELLYREWKSVYRLADIPTGKKATARCLILATMIAHLLARMLARLLLKKRPWEYSPRKWSTYLRCFAARIAAAVCRRDLVSLQKVLLELRRTAPGEVLRTSTGTATIYNVRLS